MYMKLYRKVLKLYKIQMKFANHEICQVLVISYEEVVNKTENVLNARTLFRNCNISK
jgi:hypothetical protein